jgi:hypothetical protein
MALVKAMGAGEVRQPAYDFQIAAICQWLRENGFTAHVSLRGEVVLVPKAKAAAERR